MKTVNIKAKVLKTNSDEDSLRFYITETEQIDISLTGDTGNSDLKKLFERLINLQLADDVFVQYEENDEYENVMYKQACKEYIRKLQTELDQVRQNIKEEGLNYTDTQ